MKTIRRWAENLREIAIGGLLWLIGGGGIERGLECLACGAVLPASEGAADFHRKVCPALEEIQ